MTLGNIIENYRNEHHMSQRQFALKCGLSNGYIDMLEKNRNPNTGKPIRYSTDVLKKVAAVMGITGDELVRMIDGNTEILLIDAGSSTTDLKSEIFKKIARLDPDSCIRLDAYLDGLLDNQDSQ